MDNFTLTLDLQPKTSASLITTSFFLCVPANKFIFLIESIFYLYNFVKLTFKALKDG
jgi:hypothetical protein